MTDKFFKFFDKKRLLSQLFQIVTALWFFRMVLPGVKYFFIPAFIVLAVFVIAFYYRIIFKRGYLFEFLKTFNPLLILGLFFVFALFNSDKIYEKPLRDIFEYFVNFILLITFFILTYQSKNKLGFIYVFNKTTRIIWISAFVVAIMGLVKYLLQLAGVHILTHTPYGTSFNADKNFFALYSMLGIIGLLPRLSKSDTGNKRLISYTVLTVLLLNILFSFAYRSVFLLLLAFVLMLFLQLLSLFGNKSEFVYNLSKNLRVYSIIYIIIISGFVITAYINTSFTNKIINYYYSSVINKENIKIDKEEIYTDAFHFNRWNYAIELFKSRSVVKKLFGDGFNYLSDFGKKYLNDESKSDYPHNPVLSGLLYSGITGTVFILFFLMIASYYTILYFTKYPLFSLMLFVSMFFILFSGNSIFSVPIFLFLFSLAFLIRHQEITELKSIMNINKPGAKFLKELFDYILASLALVVLFPLLITVGLIVGFTMGWPVVYTQIRIGQNGKPFKLHKFRSMKKIKSNTTVAASEQNRVTRFGKFMRKYKLDELPELWNIIRGDMSFVGPRPDVPGYADKLSGNDRVILQLKPGLTGAASLKYMYEEDLLAKQENPQDYNDKVIFPDKVLVNKKYMDRWTLWLDLKIIILTALGHSMHEDEFL